MAVSNKAIAGVRETRKGATIHKTNERPGTRAQVRYVRVSAYKAREVLDLIRGKHVDEADEILQFVERDIAIIIRKALASAVANASNNDGQDPEALYVTACYADEGPTLKRWRPRARGRATRIRKRTCHITIIVSRGTTEQLRIRNERIARSGRSGAGVAGRASRRARVAKSQAATEHTHDHEHEHEHEHDHDHDHEHDDAVEPTEVEATDAEISEVEEAAEATPEAEATAEATESGDDAVAETDEKDED